MLSRVKGRAAGTNMRAPNRARRVAELFSDPTALARIRRPHSGECGRDQGDYPEHARCGVVSQLFPTSRRPGTRPRRRPSNRGKPGQKRARNPPEDQIWMRPRSLGDTDIDIAPVRLVP
jgi:hypothetical protein